jgi:hypothetical protein
LEWYRLAGKPPAYVVERISDLRHAIDVSKTSPGAARSILGRIASDLSTHHDSEYVTAIEEASRILIDSPDRARGLIAHVVASMLKHKEQRENEKGNPWKWKRKTN